jgi:hypothetical protein
MFLQSTTGFQVYALMSMIQQYAERGLPLDARANQMIHEPSSGVRPVPAHIVVVGLGLVWMSL